MMLVGFYYLVLGYFSGWGFIEDEWKWGVESMWWVVEYVGEVGVMFGVECLNCFEMYLFNMYVDLLRFVCDVVYDYC